MKSFDLNSYLNEVYSTFPSAKRQPIIGITANYDDGKACLRDLYYKQIVDAGGTPMLIPPLSDKNVIINTLDKIDGLLLTGGGDFNPLWAGEQPSTMLHNINSERDLPELLITRLAYNRQIPMLGICRGIQTLAMSLDGKVEQDISQGMKETQGEHTTMIKHSQDAIQSEPTHTVEIKRGSMLHNVYDADFIFVNSFHHQAVSDAGMRFNVTATSPDGIIEAIESSEYKSVMGVQWHPEWLGEEGNKLFAWLVRQSEEFRRAKEIHNKLLTIDTHCDTPMLFHEGIHFEQRDPRILVDLQKMTEGMQDAVTMVAYLPQPKDNESFSDVVKFDVESPKQYADLIFNKIEEIVKNNSCHLGIARTPDDLYRNKREGRKSIMLGIENGLALENDIANVKHFAERGVVYITLCHNGDNNLCDSARGCCTNNGLSAFGEKAIREMNRCGIMVDLSHGGEKTFYDALDVSSTPIVCSHSNCKALCDVPRNLTDDQLRALSRKGGVAHITLYKGFLCKQGNANILDAMEHLEHAINVMGIEYVGLGTDFDGDGGVCGIADSSEVINFTRQLLRRRYNESDIEKIWGGNWLRVMAQVQQSAK